MPKRCPVQRVVQKWGQALHRDGKYGRGRPVAIFGRTLVSACSDRHGSSDNASHWPGTQVPSRSQDHPSGYQAWEHNVDVTWHVDLLGEARGLRACRDNPITGRCSIGIKGGHRGLPSARNPRGTRTRHTLGHLVSWLSPVRHADSKFALSYVGIKRVQIFESFQKKEDKLRFSRFRTHRIVGWLALQRFVGQNAGQEARESADDRGSDVASVLWRGSVVTDRSPLFSDLNLGEIKLLYEAIYNLKSNRPKGAATKAQLKPQIICLT